MKKNRPETRKTLWNAFKFIVAAYLIYFIFSLTDIPSLLFVLENISLKYFLLVMFFFILEIVFVTYRFWLLLGKSMPLMKIMNLVIFQKSIAAIIATTAGFATYVAGMKAEHNVKVGSGVTSFLIAKVGDLFAICIFLSLASFFVWPQVETLRLLVLIIIFGIIFGFGILMWGINNRIKLRSFIEKIFNKYSLDRYSILIKLNDYIQSLTNLDLGKYSKPLILAAGLSLLIFGATISWVFFLNQTFNISIGIWAVIFMVSLQRLMSLVPIYVLGGIGVADVTSLFLYGLFGFSQEEIAPNIIGLRIITYLLFAGVFILIPLIKLFNNRENAAE